MLYCVIIPHYNHSVTLIDVLNRLSLIPVIVVDDGSTEEHVERLKTYESNNITFEYLPENNGKGAAVCRAIEIAYCLGYTHCVQIDADGQHDLEDIPKFIEHSKRFPKSLILGAPIFAADAPLERVYGRKLSTCLVWVHTRSTSVKDALFGFRVYPVSSTKLIANQITNYRMGFDVEIIVRLLWSGVDVQNIDTKVQYPKDGVTHYKYLTDNIGQILLHFRLFLSPRPWFKRRERGSTLGFKLLLFLYKILGRKSFRLLLWPLSAYFAFFSSLKGQKKYLESASKITGKKLSSIRHIFEFSDSILDSVTSWAEGVKLDDVLWGNKGVIENLLREKKGGVILSAHFGRIESARVLQRLRPELQCKFLIFRSNSHIYRGMLEKINPASSKDIIPLEDVNPGTIIEISKLILAGQFVGILADRITAGSSARTIEVPFLGDSLSLPEGPFILSYLLKAPVVSLFCWREGEKMILEWNDLTPDANDRESYLKELATKYSSILEKACIRDPYQWFKF